ncbi:MAG: adenylate/guanylate cyclase domain-containing protein [Proteobacteria bacterium]|nr:MAG: adenylate/guanylate cyclase domain-containing protein [Pseudomonadota bacterium]
MKKLWIKWKGHFLKKLPILIICSLIVGLSYAWLMNHYFKFTTGTQDTLYVIESTIFDAKLKLRGKQKPTGKIAILAIDEKTLKTFGEWPLSRAIYTKAFENLKKAGVKWIAYDAIYAEEQKASILEISKELEQLSQGKMSKDVLDRLLSRISAMKKVSPSDQAFLEAMQKFENIIMGYYYYNTKREAEASLGSGPKFENFESMLSSEIQGIDMPKGKSLSDYPIKRVQGVKSNIPLLTQATPHFAFFSNDADDDAINRWLTLVANIDGHLMPSMALKTVAETLNREPFIFFNNYGIESLVLVNRDDESDTLEIPIDSNGRGNLLLNPRGGSQAFKHFSFIDAYNDTFSAADRKKLNGITLMMGLTATGVNDMRPNAFDPAIDGVENHAAGADNIIKGDFYKRPRSIFNTERAIVLGVGLIFTLMLMYSTAAGSGIFLLAFFAALYYVDKFFWFGKGIWTYTAIPCLEMSVMFTTVTLYKFMTEEKEKKKVKGAFQHYLSPEVIEQVLENPEQLALGGQRKDLTVFFSDVRGFTTISETLTPEKLSELMNEYFTPMTSIVLRSKGVLDKYIGDAIMAFWGAPLELANHADIAAQAAIDMLYALDKLRIEFKRKGLPDIDIGIGLNSGPMSVGNMGSGERFTYTVMGDSVNLGARLEGLTKEYGIKLMISEFTWARMTRDKFFARDLDDIRVKGKNEPVKVYHLMRPDFFPDQNMIREFIGYFESGRVAYKSQDWNAAKSAFEKCLQMKPDDKASILYVERVDSYLEEAPGQSWDGVYTFKHK